MWPRRRGEPTDSRGCGNSNIGNALFGRGKGYVDFPVGNGDVVGAVAELEVVLENTADLDAGQGENLAA
jgi:hypothetical protein